MSSPEDGRLRLELLVGDTTIEKAVVVLVHEIGAMDKRLRAAEAQVAAVRRALADELANLADDGARLSHAVVRRIEAALDSAGDRPAEEGDR